MSLHNLAHHLQSAGRGEDKVLVHMTPKEVSGLQSLAMAHGGSLTINPQTGLPEAGFLSSLLPMLIGLGLSAASGGALTPLMAAGITGAGYGMATGSLKKGIMAGLGAYGGAGLASGLGSMGASATANAANVATPTAAAFTGANVVPAVGATTGAGVNAVNAANAPFTFKDIGAGVKDLATPNAFSRLADAMPKYSITAGLTGVAGTSAAEKAEEAAEAAKNAAKQNQGMIRPYEFARTQNPEAYNIGAPMWAENPGSSSERDYFTDQYTALAPYKAPGPEYKAATGGLTSLAIGGAIEDMAAQNAVGANTGYPMADLQTSVYSNPAVQRPEATNVIAPYADAGVGTYTGEAKFAEGGTTGGYTYTYDPATQQYTQTSVPTVKPDTTSAFMRPIVSGQYQAPGVASTGSGSIPAYNWTHLLQAPGLPSIAPATPQPAANTGPVVSGGIATPVMQPSAPAQPLIPNINIPAYQTPEQQLGLGGFYDYMNQQLAGQRGYAAGGNVGGISHLGDYSDGGRLLKGPGDGVSDSIPASIGNRQPARLADGEFVVPARIVSEIGNGSTEAGARKLYAMMDRVQRARRKTVGKNQVARNTKAERLLPA